MRSVGWIGIAVMTTGLFWAAQAAAGPMRYAGTVRTVDLTTGSLVVEDVGPATRETDTPVTPRTIALGPSTEYFVAERADKGDSGYRNDWATVRASRSEIKVGEFVAVECQQEGDRCTASKLVVVRPSAP